jgi:hypothetical protein
MKQHRNSYEDLKRIRQFLVSYFTTERDSVLMALARNDPLVNDYLMSDDQLKELLKNAGFEYRSGVTAVWYIRTSLGFQGRAKRLKRYKALYELESITTTEPVDYAGRKID